MCLGRHGYCTACSEGLRRSARGLGVNALPSDCFARYVGGERWMPARGGEATHWLAHELGVHSHTPQAGCAAGYTLERRDVIGTRRELHALPAPGDLWVDLDSEGCGLVTRVQPDPALGQRILIRHLSTAPARVAEDDFYSAFNGRGSFYR